MFGLRHQTFNNGFLCNSNHHSSDMGNTGKVTPAWLQQHLVSETFQLSSDCRQSGRIKPRRD